MNNQNNMNIFLQNILQAKKQGKNPQQIMQNMFQQNPQTQQALTQLKNMANGRNPKDFIMQLARQNGAEETALGLIDEIFNS